MRFCLIVLIAFALAGCGGGGGNGSNSNSLHGTANINAAATDPKIATLDIVNGNWSTLTVAKLPRASSGWQDVRFSLRAPDHYSGMVITVVVFDDSNHSNTYDSYHELLGFMPHFLGWSGGHYIIMENGRTYSSDALNTELRVDCSFTRATAISILSLQGTDDAKKAAAQSQK